MRHRVIRGRNPYLGLDWSHGRHLGAAILACDVIYAKGAPILLMAIRDQRHANVSKQTTLLAGVVVAPPNYAA